MNLDVRTMYMAMAATCFIVAMALFILHAGRFRRGGTLSWTVGLIFQGAFWTLIGLRGLVWDYVSIVVAHTFLAASFSFLYAAVRQFQNRAYHWEVLLLPPVATFVFFWYFSAYADNVSYRIIFISLLSILQIIAILWALFRGNPIHEKRSSQLTGLAFFVMAVIFFNRLLEGLTLSHGHLSVLQPTRLGNASMIGALGVVILSSIGFVLVTRERAEEALRQRTLELHHLTETLEDRVKERTMELADLSSHLVSVQEEERKRISYDLHDNVWQTLEIIKSQIEDLFSGQEKTDWATFRQKSKLLIPLIRNTVLRIRSLQGDLWPSVLDDIGILAALEWYCREFSAGHPGLSVERHVHLAEDEVPISAKIVIYRVMQEALDNVAKHSQATRVLLSLNKEDHLLVFTVRDDGIGFNPGETMAKRSPWGGMGLLSMKQRTELSGGFFGVESTKGQGTTVRASWPLFGTS